MGVQQVCSFPAQKSPSTDNWLNCLVFPSPNEDIRNITFAEDRKAAFKFNFMSESEGPRGQCTLKRGFVKVAVKSHLTIHNRPRLLPEKEI